MSRIRRLSAITLSLSPSDGLQLQLARVDKGRISK